MSLKRNIYQQIIEFNKKTFLEKVVEVLTLEKNIYREFCKARKTGVIRSKVLDGLAMDLTDILELEGAEKTDSSHQRQQGHNPRS